MTLRFANGEDGVQALQLILVKRFVLEFGDMKTVVGVTGKMRQGCIQTEFALHASGRRVEGELDIGFLYPQQIIWDKGLVVVTRTHYWYQHERCWYVRQKCARRPMVSGG